jgi:DNA (cytosine-5)-methyltransferase 1
MQLIRFAADLRPRWIIMENVVHMRPWSGYSKLKSELQLLSYAIREQILDASHFGVPQKRKRLFILADREDTPPIVQPLRQSRSRTVREILDAPGTWRTTPLYQKGRAEDTLARAERAFRTLGKKASFLIVYYGTDGSGGWQSLDKPLRTITTIDRFALVVPSRQGPMMRMLQVSELKRAMGFSSSYALPVGTRREKVRLLGNAVCPPVMQAVVQSLIQPALQRAGR